MSARMSQNVCLCQSLGGRPGPRHVLLYEAAGGGGDLPGARQRLWPERGNLSLQVSTAKLSALPWKPFDFL